MVVGEHLDFELLAIESQLVRLQQDQPSAYHNSFRSVNGSFGPVIILRLA